MVGSTFRPFFKLGGPGDLHNDAPEKSGDERIAGVVEKSHGHEAEDEVGVIPVPAVLMKQEQENENNEDNSFLGH